MKKILFTLAASASIFSAFAIDGSFTASSIIGGVRQYTYDLDGITKVSKDNGAVQFVFNGAVVGAGTYNFASAGTFSAGVVNIPGQAGNTVSLTIDVWDKSTAATYEDALKVGKYLPSQTITITLGSDKLPPSELTGFSGGKLVLAPEPSTVALAALGLGGLLFISRRK